MPKVDPPATNMNMFTFNEDFDSTFASWKTETEKAHNGTLKIGCEEPIISDGSTSGIMIFWRIESPHSSKPLPKLAIT